MRVVFGVDGTRIKPVAAVLVVLALVLAARNSVAGDLDDLLLDREPPRMTPSVAYSPVPPNENCHYGMYNCTSRDSCKTQDCFGPDDPICKIVLRCGPCLYDVSLNQGYCSGGT